MSSVAWLVVIAAALFLVAFVFEAVSRRRKGGSTTGDLANGSPRRVDLRLILACALLVILVLAALELLVLLQ